MKTDLSDKKFSKRESEQVSLEKTLEDLKRRSCGDPAGECSIGKVRRPKRTDHQELSGVFDGRRAVMMMLNEGDCGLERPLNDRAHQRGTVAQSRRPV